jgi:hypothetical protein
MTRYLIFCLALAAAAGCKRQASTAHDSAWGDFADFYERFHQDSAYQMAHIAFPLEGLPQNADSATIAAGTFRWTPENWVIQHGFDLASSDFDHQLIPIGEDFMYEKLIHRAGDLAIVRRFAKLDGEWHLIYYAGLNMIRKEDSGIRIDGGF